jgi:hypothetical protein
MIEETIKATMDVNRSQSDHIIYKAAVEGCEITREDDGRINYVSLYERRAGVYRLALEAVVSGKAGVPKPAGTRRTLKYVLVTVLPSRLESIPIDLSHVANANITAFDKGVPKNTQSPPIKVGEIQTISYCLKDFFNNTIRSSGIDASARATQQQQSHEVSSAASAGWQPPELDPSRSWDSWDKDIAATYTEDYVDDLITIKHKNGEWPVTKKTKRMANGFFTTSFTTHNAGTVVIESPFFQEGRSYELEFGTDYTVQPSLERSFVQLATSTLAASGRLEILVFMFDRYGNPLKASGEGGSQNIPSNDFVLQTNIVPVASCNASTQVKDEHARQGDHYKISTSMFAPCIYKVKVYFI